MVPRLLWEVMLGLALSVCGVAACFGGGGGAANEPPISAEGEQNLLRNTCPDLVLYQRNERDGLERYTYEFSSTVNGNRHPVGSTVTVRCKERGQDARVFVYDKSSTYISDSPAITATCDFATKQFMLRGRVLDQVYCGRNPPFGGDSPDTFQG